MVIYITVSAALLLFVSLKVAFLRAIFHFEFPGYAHFYTALSAAITLLLILEGKKLIFNKKN
jgi:hypothetical protein